MRWMKCHGSGGVPAPLIQSVGAGLALAGSLAGERSRACEALAEVVVYSTAGLRISWS